LYAKLHSAGLTALISSAGGNRGALVLFGAAAGAIDTQPARLSLAKREPNPSERAPEEVV